ncbi:MAG: hypothetical protein RJA55_1170 [Acidobacteriota bacterium]
MTTWACARLVNQCSFRHSSQWKQLPQRKQESPYWTERNSQSL